MSKQNLKFMKKLAIILIVIISLQSGNAFARDFLENIKMGEYTEEYKEYLELEDKSNVLQPRMFDIEYVPLKQYNPLKSASLVGNGNISYFNLAGVENGTDKYIPENLKIKNQGATNLCWTFAALSSLETNLALNNANKGRETTVYDFSERHMGYVASNSFTDITEDNKHGFFNIGVNAGGNWFRASAYLTSGIGAINENDMRFSEDVGNINISDVQGKNTITQVYDTIEFPELNPNEVTQDIMNQIKNHIKTYGSVFATIHGGDDPMSSNKTYNETCYNTTSYAQFCNNSETCLRNHAISIIGWDDTYSKDNFTNTPTKNGAWIVRNSYGDAFGEEGFFYISYEDINIYKDMNGIIKATDAENYDNVYQYNYLGYSASIEQNEDNPQPWYIRNIFYRKDINQKEYLTQVGLNVAEACKCSVFIKNGAGNLEKVDLLEGNDDSVEELKSAGYHTLEFAEPIELTGTNFEVVVKIENSKEILIEAQIRR